MFFIIKKTNLAYAIDIFLRLMVFPVTFYRPYSHKSGDNEKSEKLMGNAKEATTTHEHRTYAIDEIVHRVYVCGEVTKVPGR